MNIVYPYVWYKNEFFYYKELDSELYKVCTGKSRVPLPDDLVVWNNPREITLTPKGVRLPVLSKGRDFVMITQEYVDNHPEEFI